MGQERKNIRFYLRPDRSENESKACEMLDRVEAGWHNDIAKSAFLAGMALRSISESLPDAMAGLLRANATPEEVQVMLLSMLETIGGRQRKQGISSASAPETEKEPIASKRAKNLASLLPD